LVKDAEDEGVEVFIAGAGGAAHLAGVIASNTLKPVIGVPVPCEPFIGFDSLLSMVQMPPGVPVGTVSCGKPGGTNSAILALRILALKDEKIREGLMRYKEKMLKKIQSDAEEVERRNKEGS